MGGPETTRRTGKRVRIEIKARRGRKTGVISTLIKNRRRFSTATRIN